jgi:hypothetical protein
MPDENYRHNRISSSNRFLPETLPRIPKPSARDRAWGCGRSAGLISKPGLI